MISFSIIVPVYNKEQFLLKTIERVLNQKHSHFELLLLNDGSTDGSQKVINTFEDSRIKKFNTQNIGAAAARNFLMEKATHDYIAFLDADDLWEENHLEEMSRLIVKYPNNKVFATNTIKTVGKAVIHRKYSIDIHNKTDLVTDFFKASFLECIMITSATAMHKEVFENIGNYNVNIKSGQDIDLYIRLASRYKIAFSTSVTVTIVGNPMSLSNRTSYKDKMNFEDIMLNEKENSYAKKYYDLNRCALAIMAKEQKYLKSFEKLISLIDFDNLHWKQRILLNLPPKVLSILFYLKKQLFSIGIPFTVFK